MALIRDRCSSFLALAGALAAMTPASAQRPAEAVPLGNRGQAGETTETAAAIDDSTVTRLPARQSAGTTWPYQDLLGDRRRYGTPFSPLVPRVGEGAFFTPFLYETYVGPGHLGGLQAGFFLGQVRGAPSAGQVNRNYTALQTLMSATANLGGSGTTMASGRGQVFGFSPLAVLYPGATGVLNVTGGEINVQVSRGAGVAYKSGIQIVAMPDDAVQGSVYDAAVSISNQAGAVGFRHGILFSAANGRGAVSQDGTLIGTMDTPRLSNGVDLTGATFSGSAFASRGFAVDGSGGIRAQGITVERPDAAARLGAAGAPGTGSIRFATSGSTAGYDSAISGRGGNGAPGNGGISVDASTVEPVHPGRTSLGTAEKPWALLAATIHQLVPAKFGQLPPCGSALAGALAYVTDAREPVTSWHQPVAHGGGSTKALIACIGADWVAL